MRRAIGPARARYTVLVLITRSGNGDRNGCLERKIVRIYEDASISRQQAVGGGGAGGV